MAKSDVTSQAPEGTSITVRITAVMEREFIRRGVFADLRISNAERIVHGATGVHSIGIELAEELLADADEKRLRGSELPRGVPVAYAALAREIKEKLRQEARRGTWDDPGQDEAVRRSTESPALFHVGDEALYFGDDDEYGLPVVIAYEFKTYQVTDDDGVYSDRTGKRFNYKAGYCVRKPGSEHVFFAAAHRLTGGDCKPSHLRLVHPAAEQGARR